MVSEFQSEDQLRRDCSPQLAYYYRNRETSQARMHEWNRNNKDYVQLYNRTRYQAQHTERLEYFRKYREEHRAEINDRARERSSQRRLEKMAKEETALEISASDVKIALTVPEAARAIGVSEVHMWRMVGKKIIPSIKIGRSRRILVSALEKYVESLADDAEE